MQPGPADPQGYPAPACLSLSTFFLLKKKKIIYFIWPHRVLAAALRIIDLHCVEQDL